MASDNPSKFMWEENALNTYGPGQPRDILNQIYQQYAQNPSGMNQYMQYGADQMAQFGMEGFLPYLAQSNAQIASGNQAAGAMFGLAGQAAPQINMSGMPNVQSQNVNAAMANYNPAFTQAYMNAAPIEQALSAANRDMYRQLSENTLTQIGMGSGQGGNTGSSRRGMAEAIAGRGVLDRAADVAGQMYQDAYGAGAQLGSQYGFANQAAMNNMGQFNAGNSLQAQLANQSQWGDLSRANLQSSIYGNQLAGQMYNNIYQGGLDSLGQSYNFAAQAPGFTLGAGETQNSAPWNTLSQYSGLLHPWAMPGAGPSGMELESSGWSKALAGINAVGNVMGGVGRLASGFGFGS